MRYIKIFSKINLTYNTYMYWCNAKWAQGRKVTRKINKQIANLAFEYDKRQSDK